MRILTYVHKHYPGPYHKTPLQVLVDIPEIQILSVRQVAKRCGAEISTFETSFFTGLDLVSPMIFGFHEDPEGHNDDDLDEVTDIVNRISNFTPIHNHMSFWLEKV